MPILQRRPSAQSSWTTRDSKAPRSSHSQITPATSPCLSSRSTNTLADNVRGGQRRYSFSSTSTRHDGGADPKEQPSIPIPWFEIHKDTDTLGVAEPSLHSSSGIPENEQSPSYVNAPDASVSHPDLAEMSSPSSSPAVTNITLDSPSSPFPIHNSSRPGSPPSVKRKHAVFYITDSLVTLEVEGSLFRVHRSFLQRESTYLGEILSRDILIGTSDENAIKLAGISIHELECLLRFLYYGAYKPNTYTLNDWMDLLGATMALGCIHLRHRVISELESPVFSSSMDIVDRILIARKYDIDAWLRPAYIELCLRDESLGKQDIDFLGSKLASQLCLVRERLLLEAMDNMLVRNQTGTSEPGRKSSRRAKQLVEEIVFTHRMDHLD